MPLEMKERFYTALGKKLFYRTASIFFVNFHTHTEIGRRMGERESNGAFFWEG